MEKLLLALAIVLSLIFCTQSSLIQIKVGTFFKNCTSYTTGHGVEYYQLYNTTKAPEKNKINIYLYKNNSAIPSVYPLPVAVNEILKSQSFDKNLPVVFFIHGFRETPNNVSMHLLIKSLLTKGNLNVLYLDSSQLIGSWYMYSVTAVRFIGRHLAEELEKLVRGGVPVKHIHLIGFSLGAHIAGFAGKSFKELTGESLSRISGLDPAGPCFFENSGNLRLNSTDADFVDVIHSNAGAWGIVKAIGHVDYYPNGGSNQHHDLPGGSHRKAWEYYAESIAYPKNFEAAECLDWYKFISGACYNNTRSWMGYYANNTDRGVYYLRTKEYPPYGFGNRSVPIGFWNFLFP